MIKIQNIFYMLAYAFCVLQEDSYKKIELEEFEYAEDLLAAILAKGIANQTKRGLGCEYVPCTETLSFLRGKINISSSLKERTILRRQLVCEFDEFSENAYVNQILKTTALLLIRSDGVKQERKNALKKVMLYFHAVDTLNSQTIQWSAIKYHSNNATYKMLINICYLVVKSLAPTARDGPKKLSQFRGEQMPRLFERFVRAYYQKHYPCCKVSASHIKWNVDDGVVELLPTMKSDIVLERDGKVLIIDTKYYGEVMQASDRGNSRSKIHSGHLYQIFAYVKNKDIHRSGNVNGVLLYAKTDEEIVPDNSYQIDGNKISVRTLDLDKDFVGIRNQLDRIVAEW